MLYSRLSKPVILVVDDIEEMRELVSVVLVKNGYSVLTAEGGAAMDGILSREKVDLILLDSMMPDEDGLSICRRLSETDAPPIIMLSALGEDVDRIKGLNVGAEDYIAKPFHPDELIARIKIALRRSKRQVGERIAKFFGWKLDTISRVLTSPDGLSLALSPIEFAVLCVLLENPDRPLKRNFILARMADRHEITTARALDTIVSRLRRKLAEIHPNAREGDELIRTVYAVGYMLRPKRG